MSLSHFPSPSTQKLAPPAAPCPWLWRCHGCHIWYRLATTRRCLECDHDFCLSANTPTSSSHKRKRPGGGPCRAEFDYIGWAARGAWRRTLLLNDDNSNNSSSNTRITTHGSRDHHTTDATDNKNDDDDNDSNGGVLLAHRRWLPQSSLTGAWGDEHSALNEHGIEQLTDRFTEKKEALQVRRQHNCWLHCDFPSECHHAVYKARQEGRPVLARARALDEAYACARAARRTQRRTAAGAVEMVSKACGGPTTGQLRRTSLARYSAVKMEEEEEEEGGYETSDSSDSSDSEFDEAVDDDDDNDDDSASLPGSPPTEDEVTGAAVSPPILPRNKHASPDMDKDYSYTTFKEIAGIESTPPPACNPSPPPATTLTFEIYEDENQPVPVPIPSYSSPPTSPVNSSATTAPIAIPPGQAAHHLPSLLTTFEPFRSASRDRNTPATQHKCP